MEQIKDINFGLDLKKGMKISSLIKLWPKVVGPKFEKKSKIFSVQESGGSDIIIVAVSSSAIAQELIFYKNDIIKKIYKVAKNLEFKVKDVQFSTKFWKEENES